MPLLTFPNECLDDILSFLDYKSLYKCLFVDRLWCKHSVILIWREPFNCHNDDEDHASANKKCSIVINTLLGCINEDEIASLIPYSLKFNNQTPLFDYG